MRSPFSTRIPGTVPCYKLGVSLRKESKRGLIALAVLCVVGLATFASVSSLGASFGRASLGVGHAKDAVATRVPPAP
jgi:hypothetical protein